VLIPVVLAMMKPLIKVQEKTVKGSRRNALFVSRSCGKRRVVGWLTAGIVVLATIMLSGCGAASKGGDTTCAEYAKLSKSDQTKVVTDLLKETGDEPSGLRVNVAKGSIKLYCATVGKSDSKIREING
jgi:acid stress chaperone HdeA